MNKVFLVLLMMSFTVKVFSSQSPQKLTRLNEFRTDTVAISDSLQVRYTISMEKMLVRHFPKMDEERRKKLISAALAFPFPLGFMGAHRVMLGCKPWIPVVYVATFGGCFGLIPLIDFIAILHSKDISEFENNPNVFMWLK
jgi:TM2 domain-containing membrane protein YozV